MNSFVYETALGTVTLTDDGFAIVRFAFGAVVGEDAVQEETPLLREAYAQLCEYFDGKRQVFQLNLAPQGTEFQKKVWSALYKIPYGETRSYGEIAREIGSPRACRAVGGANNKNPLAIFVPCHRVLGAKGDLVGFAFGLDKKRFLLELEAKTAKMSKENGEN